MKWTYRSTLSGAEVDVLVDDFEKYDRKSPMLRVDGVTITHDDYYKLDDLISGWIAELGGDYDDNMSRMHLLDAYKLGYGLHNSPSFKKQTLTYLSRRARLEALPESLGFTDDDFQTLAVFMDSSPINVAAEKANNTELLRIADIAAIRSFRETIKKEKLDDGSDAVYDTGS